MTETIVRMPLRRQVRARLLEGLLRGTPAPGTAINESELSVDLGVSRTPLREALLSLEREGLIGYEPGRGFSVRPLSAAEAEELYPMVWTLEALALRSAAMRPAAHLDALDALNQELRLAGGRPEVALALDQRWHRGLVEPCANRRLLDMLETLKAQAFRYEYALMSESGRIFGSAGQHEAITAALRAGHLAAAVETLERHWRGGLDFIVPWLHERRR